MGGRAGVAPGNDGFGSGLRHSRLTDGEAGCLGSRTSHIGGENRGKAAMRDHALVEDFGLGARIKVECDSCKRVGLIATTTFALRPVHFRARSQALAALPGGAVQKGESRCVRHLGGTGEGRETGYDPERTMRTSRVEI